MTDRPSGQKSVQIELSESKCRRLEAIAGEENRPKKELLREAVSEYLDRRKPFDPDDPFFTFHDRVDVPVGERTTPSEIDDDLYGSPDI